VSFSKIYSTCKLYRLVPHGAYDGEWVKSPPTGMGIVNNCLRMLKAITVSSIIKRKPEK